MTRRVVWRRRKGKGVSIPQRFFSNFPKSFFMAEYRVKEFCNFYEIERKSVVCGVKNGIKYHYF